MILLKEDREPVGSPAGSLLTLALDPGKVFEGHSLNYAVHISLCLT